MTAQMKICITTFIEMSKQRNPYFGILRGIAIIFVIGIHTFPVVPSMAEIILRQVIQCAVPLFIAISGYFIGKKFLSTKKTYLSFLKKQVSRVYFPMLLWSLPWLVFAIHSGGNPLRNIAFALVGGMSIFYFIPLIMQYYTLTPLIQWTVSKHFWTGGGISALLTFVAVVLLVYVQHVVCLNLSLVSSISPFPLWCLFYYIGVAAASDKLPKVNPLWWLAGLFLTIGICFLEIEMLKPFGHTVYGLKTSGQLISFFAVMFALSPSVREKFKSDTQKKLPYLAAYIGRVSFFIYLTHCLVILVYNYLVNIDCWVIKWAVTTTVSLLGAGIMQKIISDRFYRFIGL